MPFESGFDSFTLRPTRTAPTIVSSATTLTICQKALKMFCGEEIIQQSTLNSQIEMEGWINERINQQKSPIAVSS